MGKRGQFQPFLETAIQLDGGTTHQSGDFPQTEGGSLPPARRAVRVNPMSMMRTE